MNVVATDLPGVLMIEPKVFGDERGFFYESFNEHAFNDAVGRPVTFVQDNHSRSARGVLRGLHYQVDQTQAKLVRVVRGTVYDVAVDLRSSSATFGHWVGIELNETNHRQLWIPEGFGHGFVVTSDSADFLYKTTDYWAPKAERCIVWNDETLAIDWPLQGSPPIVSGKDLAGARFADAEVFA